MLDFTLNNLGKTEGLPSGSSSPAAAGSSEAGASGDSFARALAAYTETAPDEEGSDDDPNGDPTKVVDTCGIPFVSNTPLPDVSAALVELAASGLDDAAGALPSDEFATTGNQGFGTTAAGAASQTPAAQPSTNVDATGDAETSAPNSAKPTSGAAVSEAGISAVAEALAAAGRAELVADVPMDQVPDVQAPPADENTAHEIKDEAPTPKEAGVRADIRADARSRANIEAQVEESARDLPAPYHVRNTSAFSSELGQNGSKESSSGHGYRSFGFGGGAGTQAQIASSLKLAGASFASALANTPVEGALPAETANQIVQSLKLQWARGGGEAEIRLEPHHFGELKIALKVEDGRVNARLEADAPVVREWLQTNQSLLKQSLAEQNLTLEGLEVVEPKESRDADRHERQSGRDGQPRGRQGRRRRAEGGELFEVVA